MPASKGGIFKVLRFYCTAQRLCISLLGAIVPKDRVKKLGIGQVIRSACGIEQLYRTNTRRGAFDNWPVRQSILVLGLLAYVSLIIMIRIAGKRTLSQMREFDFIVSVALGSTLATVLLRNDVSLADGVVAIGILISLQYLLAYLSLRSTKFSKLISAEPTLLFYKGNFLHTALKKERITENEIRSILRSNGINSFEHVEAVVMETNGEFSVVEQGGLPQRDSSLANVKRIV